MIKDGENGFIAEVEDINDLSESAIKIVTDDALKKKFSQNGLNTVKKYQRKNIINNYYLKIYKKLLKS